MMMMMAKPSMIVFPLFFIYSFFTTGARSLATVANFLFHLVLSLSHPAARPQGATTQTRLGAIHIIVSSSSVYFSSFSMRVGALFSQGQNDGWFLLLLPGWIHSYGSSIYHPFLLKNASSSRYYEETAIGQFFFSLLNSIVSV